MNNTTLQSTVAVPFVGVNTNLGLYVTFMVLGLFGNGILLAVIFRRTTPRTVFEMFIVNLAVSNVLLLLIHVPLKVYQLIRPIQANVFFCKVIYPMITGLFCCEILTITAMSLHRYWVIVYPFKPKPTTRTAFIWIVLIWTGSLIIVLPLVIINKVHSSGQCFESWPTLQHRQAYTVTLCILQYTLPLILIAAAYIRVARSLFQSRVPGWHSNKTHNVQVVKSTMTIVVMFAICMLPGQIAWLMMDFGGESVDPEVLTILLDCGNLGSSLHTAIDPVVYGIFVKEYRRDYINLLQCKPARPVFPRQRSSVEMMTYHFSARDRSRRFIDLH